VALSATSCSSGTLQPYTIQKSVTAICRAFCTVLPRLNTPSLRRYTCMIRGHNHNVRKWCVNFE
jgi:hypothetical protein